MSFFHLVKSVMGNGTFAPFAKEDGNCPVSPFSVSLSDGNDRETVVDTQSGTIYILAIRRKKKAKHEYENIRGRRHSRFVRQT